MMVPNQIINQRFSLAGKGGYKASEVDAFIQRVFQNYNKLYNDNNILKEYVDVTEFRSNPDISIPMKNIYILFRKNLTELFIIQVIDK